MPKTKEQKEQIVGNLKEKLGRMRSMIFAGYEGLTVPEIQELQRELRKEGAECQVAKKTLLSIAFKENGMEIDPRSIPGNFAVVFGFEDEVAPARVLAKFAKTHEALTVTAGVLEGTLIPREKVLALSRLPSKQELYAQAVGSIAAPLQGIAGVLAGNLRKFIYALGAIKDAKSA